MNKMIPSPKEVISENTESALDSDSNQSKIELNSGSQNLFENVKIKDVGYSWVVLGAMFISNILTTGYVKGFSLIYNEVLDTYPDASGTMSGIMMGLLSGCRSLFAPFVGIIGNLIGIRPTLCIGTFIYVIGLLASFFCTSALQLSFTLGAMVGFSHCIIESCQVVVISQFFESKLPMANGIRVAGNPFGGMVYPFMVSFFLQTFGLKLFFIILAAVTLHIFICSFLMRPIDTHVKIRAKYYATNFDSNSYNGEMTPFCTNMPLIDKQKQIYNKILQQNVNLSNRKARKPLDISFLKKIHFLVFILLAAVIPMSLPLVLFHVSIYAKIDLGLSPYDISTLLSFQAFFDFFLRLLLGWLNNRNYYKINNGLIFCFCCSALGTIWVPFTPSLWFLFMAVSLYSFGPASYHSFINVILSKRFGKDSIASTWGLVRMTQGIFSFVHPTLIGYILDQTGSYTIPFLVMGCGMFFCSAMVVAGNLLTPHGQEKTQKKAFNL